MCNAVNARADSHPGVLVGLDIGGTKTAVTIANHQRAILSELVVPTQVASEAQFMESITAGINAALADNGRGPNDVLAIGAGVPGQVDPATGTVQHAVNLNLVEFPLGEALGGPYRAPVVVENDVRLAAVGVYDTLRQQAPLQHLAYVSVGTGIAAGLVLHGRLYRGANGMAGEIGHMLLEPDGERCACGARGCLETLVSGPAIARQAAPALRAAGFQPPYTAEHAFTAASAGVTAVQQVIQRVGRTLARAIQWLVMTYDVEKVVLGGGVTRAGTAFMEPVLSELSHLRTSSPLAESLLLPEKVQWWPAVVNAGTRGAILLAQEALAA